MRRLKLALRKENVQAIFIALLLWCTQITFSIPNPISVSNKASINVATIALLAVFVWIILYRLIFKRGFCRLSKQGKAIFGLSAVFALACVVLLVLRFVVWNRLTISVSMTLSIALAVTFYYLFELHILTKSSMLKGSTLFVSSMNVYALMLMIYYHGEVRTSQMIHFLGNINVYIGLIVFCTPLILQFCRKASNRSVRTILLIGNIFITSVMLVLSGSRYGFLCYLFELILIYFVMYGFCWKGKVMALAGSLFACVILVVGICCYWNPYVRHSVQRTIYYPNAVLSRVFHVEIRLPASDHIPDDPLDILPEPSEPSDDPAGGEEWTNCELSDPDHEAPSANGVVQSLTRPRLWARTRNVLQKYWPLGTGRDALYMWGWGYQSTHNFILDAVLCHGVVGAVIYLLLSCFPLYSLLFRKNKSIDQKLYCIGFLLLLGYSMLQPLLSNKLVILLAVWGCYGALLSEPNG
nr:O-antigen ligase [bacterium]